MNRKGHTFQDLSSLYTSMSNYWSILMDLGDGILNCQSLEELKMRKEIATKCAKIVNNFDLLLTNECKLIISKSKEDLTSKQDDVDEINASTIHLLNQKHDDILAKVIDEFNKETQIMSYPNEIIVEYQTRIENNLNRVKVFFLSIWKTEWTIARETNKIKKLKHKLVVKVSDLIKTGSSLNTFDQYVEKEFKESDKEYNEHLKNLYDSNDQFISKIQHFYNLFQNECAYNKKYFNFEVTISDFEKEIDA